MWTLINKKSVVKDITSFKSIKIFGVTFWNTTFFSIWPFSQLKKGESVKAQVNETHSQSFWMLQITGQINLLHHFPSY